jgi:hypothetical protein
LGHISISKLKLALKNKLIKGLISDKDIKDGKIELCYDCMRGKMEADPSGSSTEY